MPRLLPQGLAHSRWNHDTEATAIKLRPARDPRHVTGNVETAPKGIDDILRVEKAKARERGVVANARVGVLDGEIPSIVIDERQGEMKSRDEVEPAPEVVDLV